MQRAHAEEHDVSVADGHARDMSDDPVRTERLRLAAVVWSTVLLTPLWGLTWLGVRDNPSEMEAVIRSESKVSAQKEAVTPNICITMTKHRKPVKRIETRRIRAERVGAITLPGCSQRGAV